MAAKRLIKYLASTIALSLGVAFVVKFAGPNILRQYISYGIGDCKSIPILCRQPQDYAFKPEINKEYLGTLIPQNFPKMSVAVPKGFDLVQELIKRPYYKKNHPNNHTNHKSVIYLLFQGPGSFIKLYPDVRKQGIKDNAEFIRQLMGANLGQLNNLTDAFFVIMKSVLTPDIGNQSTAKMIKFELGEIKGYINYTMSKPDNYFDCNVLDEKDNFFKVYIKDAGARLDLNNVFAIISTLKPIK